MQIGGEFLLALKKRESNPQGCGGIFGHHDFHRRKLSAFSRTDACKRAGFLIGSDYWQLARTHFRMEHSKKVRITQSGVLERVWARQIEMVYSVAYLEVEIAYP